VAASGATVAASGATVAASGATVAEAGATVAASGATVAEAGGVGTGRVPHVATAETCASWPDANRGGARI